jgi:hypothetical protein
MDTRTWSTKWNGSQGLELEAQPTCSNATYTLRLLNETVDFDHLEERGFRKPLGPNNRLNFFSKSRYVFGVFCQIKDNLCEGLKAPHLRFSKEDQHRVN